MKNEIKLLCFLSFIMMTTTTTEECPICLTVLLDDSTKVKTQCHHVFHNACLKTWLQTNTTCPLCRLTCRHLIQDITPEECHILFLDYI